MSFISTRTFLLSSQSIFQSFNFLIKKSMAGPRNDVVWPIKARKQLKVFLVGAGITGLTTALALSLTGHIVTIYESTHSLTQVGAGLQIAPNASRILARLGVLDQVMEKANVLEGLSLRRWEDDVEIGRAPLMPGVSLPST